MSLAARFPLKSYRKEITYSMINGPQVCTVQREGNDNQDRKILDQSICEMNSKNKEITGNSEEKV